MEQAEIRDVIHAIILAATSPVTYDKLVEVLSDVDNNHIKTALNQLLKTNYPIQQLVKIAGGYRFQIKQEFAPWIAKATGEQNKREKVTRVMLETLAIIAYKQPITRGEIETIRGGNLHATILEQLEERNWIKIIGYGGVSKRAGLYGTTKEFLVYFGLNSVHELPAIEELEALLM